MSSHDTNTQGTKKNNNKKKTTTVFDTTAMRMKCGDKKWRMAGEVVLKWVLIVLSTFCVHIHILWKRQGETKSRG